jgi:DNA-binding winged helix-turn-helix (wHTH) protein
VRKNATPMTTPAAQGKEILSFGPFRLVLSERLLTNDGVPVDLSPRAFDILVTLVSRSTKVVSKSDLMDQVWPGIAVEESTLRFHVANLRKALGDGRNGARYITTVSGRGYCFVALVSRSSEQNRSPKASVSDFQHANLPSRSAMIDREDDLAALLAGLEAEWFVTIVGSGGRRQYSPLCCLALNRISRLQTARLRADEPHFPAVAQTVGFGLGRSKILYFSRWID